MGASKFVPCDCPSFAVLSKNKMSRTLLFLAATFCSLSHVSAATINLVSVGNAGNANDATGFGAVGYAYQIGKYEVTAGQYADFLNKVAATDTYGLYHLNMADDPYGCKIERSGTSGNYTYGVALGYGNRPVNFVSWGSAARFANWMHNGQPTGSQSVNTTETGSYNLLGAVSNTDLMAVTRQSTASWVIPTEGEWYKAAYHANDGVTGNYWTYPTGTGIAPANQLLEPDPGNTATFFDGSTYTIGSPYWRTDVGAHSNSFSSYGTFDQGGNVKEWNEANISGVDRGTRGGSFASVSSLMESSSRGISQPTVVSSDIGFRLVLLTPVPEPGTITLLLGGVVIGFFWWWHRKSATY